MTQNLTAETLELTAKDFKTDQEVRWCPGCGDYAILAAVQAFLPTLGIPREKIVIISGIGCSSRFPYYMNTYGMHSIHGRAPAIATGLAVSRPDLSVWVVTGDGDALSIGGNHLIHTLRRNVNLNILLFNNQIYGLTKGQYSPTSELGKVTKSTPVGSVDAPFSPLSLALGAQASFVARSLDTDRKHLIATLEAVAAHKGTSFLEILQNCNIFNDGAFDRIKDRDTKDQYLLKLENGEPMRFGDEEHPRGVVQGENGELRIAENPAESEIVTHNTKLENPAYAFSLAQLDSEITPMGVLRDVERDAYGELMNAQLGPGSDHEALMSVLRGPETWTVE